MDFRKSTILIAVLSVICFILGVAFSIAIGYHYRANSAQPKLQNQSEMDGDVQPKLENKSEINLQTPMPPTKSEGTNIRSNPKEQAREKAPEVIITFAIIFFFLGVVCSVYTVYACFLRSTIRVVEISSEECSSPRDELSGMTLRSIASRGQEDLTSEPEDLVSEQDSANPAPEALTSEPEDLFTEQDSATPAPEGLINEPGDPVNEQNPAQQAVEN